MPKRYQLSYAAGRPQMYDRVSREQKARRIIKTLGDFFGKDLKNLTLLDLGSSTGIIDNVLANKFKKVVGTDIDREAISFAKKNFQKKNLEFKVEDAMKLSFPDNNFDVVVCTHVYEHVPDQKQLFSEIYRVLKPGGVCYLAAQNKLWPWEPHYNLPFLSWLPNLVANFYLQITGKAKEYYETPVTYWKLKQLTKQFGVYEYTQRIIRNPTKFDYNTLAHPLLKIIIWPLSPVAKYFSPTFFWLLEK